MVRISPGILDDPRVIGLLKVHFATARAETAPGSAHALDLAGLRSPDIDVWTMWEGDALVAVGALKRLSVEHSEIKSMHTAEFARRRGFGGMMLRHIIATARALEMSRLSLETGSWTYFNAARALYARHGFKECPPFGDLRAGPEQRIHVARPVRLADRPGLRAGGATRHLPAVLHRPHIAAKGVGGL